MLWPNVDNDDFKEALEAAEDGESPNNVSTILTYRTGEITFMWMGDLETELMEKIVDEVKWPKVHILFAAHHGRSSGRVPHAILDKIKPRIIVIGEEVAASALLRWIRESHAEFCWRHYLRMRWEQGTHFCFSKHI